MVYKPETLAVHAGQEVDSSKSRALPIHQTTSFVFDSTEHAADLFALKTPGYIYTRIMNPTQNAFEERMTALEGGLASLATASGASAITYAVLNLATAGDNILATSKLYGGTFALFAHTLPQFGIEVRFVDPDRPEDLAGLTDDRTRLVFGEVVGNPSLNVLDVPAWADAAHALGLPLIVDNTVPTPLLSRVLDLGADISVHSATKYIGGHGTTMGGVIVDSGRFDWKADPDRFPVLTGPDHAYHEVVWTEAAGAAAYIIRARTVMLRNTGAAIAPISAWLLMQGLETLPLRMERHSENALKIAQYLSAHPKVAWVNYPGLPEDPYHEVAKRVLSGGYGGLVSFGVKAGREGGAKLIDALQLFSHLANIGDAKSLAIHNATTTHSQLTESELVAAGVQPDMVRLSVGIEHVDDLIADLEQALSD